jgi:hypothetical protein
LEDIEGIGLGNYKVLVYFKVVVVVIAEELAIVKVDIAIILTGIRLDLI